MEPLLHLGFVTLTEESRSAVDLPARWLGVRGSGSAPTSRVAGARGRFLGERRVEDALPDALRNLPSVVVVRDLGATAKWSRRRPAGRVGAPPSAS